MNKLEMNKENDILTRGYVTYEDFGAVGDGVTDDFRAIREAHLFANEKGLKVLGTPDKNYLIFDTSLGTDKIYSVEIKTDVDWQGATITVDDRKITTIPGGPYFAMGKRHVFDVLPNDDVAMLKISDEKKLLESREVSSARKAKFERLRISIIASDTSSELTLKL